MFRRPLECFSGVCSICSVVVLDSTIGNVLVRFTKWGQFESGLIFGGRMIRVMVLGVGRGKDLKTELGSSSAGLWWVRYVPHARQ